MYLISPFQSLWCTTAKSTFLKHGSNLSLPCSEPPSVPFVCRIKSNVSGNPFLVTLCAVLLHLSCILVNVSSDYSPEYTFVLAYILLFTWEGPDLITVDFKGWLRSTMVTDGSYTCGEHSTMYRLVESLCCTCETNVTLCVNLDVNKINK